MAQGFQCWDAAGNLVFDTSSMSGKIVGSVQTSGATGSVNLPVSGLGTPFFIVPFWPTSIGQYYNYLNGAYISISGTTLSWNFPFPGSNPIAITVYYGFY